MKRSRKSSGPVGEVGILNVGAGDTKLVFDPTKPDEVERSARIVKDMIRRGFVLLIEVGRDEQGPIYRRAHDFDETTAEYIIAGTTSEPEQKDEQIPASAPRRSAKGKAKAKPTRVPAHRTKAVAVSRTAGG
ncbi:hypothetical protein [Sphingopyxis flava]|uniref:Uncharacterized protein n=1 Tax=Sphingopyxis flava TaxID=1507287 RepID=A0A1T5ADS4_9SPHN|nr:hypothetical protein [Sphingopyxis flava]SKB32823.1 hypothetical protein SAMN06295937_1003114 [Sphingopyxis flava]